MSKIKIFDGKIKNNDSFLELINKIESLQDKFNVIDQLTDIAKSEGNYDANLYLWGMANGMILIQSVIKDIDPIYLNKPKFKKK